MQSSRISIGKVGRVENSREGRSTCMAWPGRRRSSLLTLRSRMPYLNGSTPVHKVQVVSSIVQWEDINNEPNPTINGCRLSLYVPCFTCTPTLAPVARGAMHGPLRLIVCISVRRYLEKRNLSVFTILPCRIMPPPKGSMQRES
jgi:hypothetical protein